MNASLKLWNSLKFTLNLIKINLQNVLQVSWLWRRPRAKCTSLIAIWSPRRSSIKAIICFFQALPLMANHSKVITVNQMKFSSRFVIICRIGQLSAKASVFLIRKTKLKTTTRRNGEPMVLLNGLWLLSINWSRFKKKTKANYPYRNGEPPNLTWHSWLSSWSVPLVVVSTGSIILRSAKSHREFITR